MSDWISPDWVADHLNQAKPNGSGYVGQCPAHEDSWPSFRVGEGEKGTIMYCHAGCTIDALCDALNIRKEQLFYDVASSPYDETGAALRQLIASQTPVDLWEVETLGDVMQAALETDVLTVEEWVHVRTFTGVNYGWLMSMPYQESMRYWAIMRAGLLWEYLNKWWVRKDKPDWNLVADHANRRMRKVWRERSAI